MTFSFNTMTKIHLTRIFIALLAALCLASCGDYLNVNSEQQLTYDTFYKSAADCRSATAVLYTAPWFDFNGSFSWEIGDARANNMYIDLSTYASAKHNRFVADNNTDHLITGWNSLYNVVCQSDHIINNLYRAEQNGVSKADVDACRGEARFMRGLAYWYLMSLWGDVPIVEDPIKITENAEIAPNCREDVLQYAIADMEYAADNLPTTDDAGRVTRYSALGMLARLYVTAACYARGGLFTEGRYNTSADYYYDKARQAALRVCTEGTQYQLLTDYEELFRTQNNNNSESLFALQWVPGSTTYGVGNRVQTSLCYTSNLLGGYTAYGGSCYLSAELVELMHSRGETSRLKAAGFVNGTTYTYIGTDTEEGCWTVSGKSMCPIKKHIVGGSKDTDGAAVNGNSGFATPMLRLAEVYLLLAEATLGTHSSLSEVDAEQAKTALLYFNKVHSRSRNATAGTDLTDLTLDDIWTERRVELAIENQFWYDIVRRAYWDELWVIDFLNSQRRGYKYKYDGKTFTWRTSDGREAKTADASQLLLPYPLAEVTLNPKLEARAEHFDIND